MRTKPRPAELDAKLKALAARAKRGDEEARIVLQTVALLSRTLDSPLSLQAMAASVYVSRTRLCAVFKRETGVSIGECQSMMRMARAKTLLAKTDLPMSAIAAAVGFERQGSFTERFRECEGTTPLAWRRAYRYLVREKERREASMHREAEKRVPPANDAGGSRRSSGGNPNAPARSSGNPEDVQAPPHGGSTGLPPRADAAAPPARGVQ